MFVPDMFHFWLNEIITSFLYSLEGTGGGGGLLQKINIIRFFVIVRCGNDCYKTVLVHNKLFDSISQVLVTSLTMNCYMFGYIYFTHDMLFIYFL